MASTFPGAIDSFTDPLSGSALNSPSHSAQHADLNDAAEKLETYMGLVKVIPTSVTNGTLSATGTVTIGNAVSSVTVSGCFSSLYNVYKVVLNGGASSATCDLQIQLNGITTALYAHNLLYLTLGSTTVNGFSQTAQTAWNYVGAATTSNMMLNCEIFSPNLAKVKTFTSMQFYPHALAVGNFYMSAGVCDSTTQSTGFLIRPSTGTITGGQITVYGYRI